MPSTWWCSPATLDGAPTPVAAVELLRRAGFEFGAPQPTSRTLLDTADGRLHCAGARLEARPVYLPGTADAVELVADGGGLPTRRLIVERLMIARAATSALSAMTRAAVRNGRLAS